MLQPIFRYPGGKSRTGVRQWIMKHAPANYNEYREPFVGGGGIFFAVPSDKIRWINDINEGLIAVYEALRDQPEEFIKACRAIEPPKPGERLSAAKPDSPHGRAKGKALYNARLKEHFDFFKNNNKCDQALRYYFINRTVWAGRVVYDQQSRLYFSVPEGWNIVATDKLEKAAEHMRDVTITCGDYKELLTAEGEDVWIYCDPPYVVNTRLSKNSRQYRDNFEDQDHHDFAEAVKNSPHKIAISYDDHPLVRKLFPKNQFHYSETTWAYCGTAGDKSQVLEGQDKRQKRVGKELLIMNYEV